jgi:UDP-glucose 4-epimerase
LVINFIGAVQGRRVLVTGATGFIGAQVLATGRLLKAELHILARQPLTMADLNCWCGDLGDERRIAEIIAELQPHAILHLAAAGVQFGASNVRELLRINALGLATILETIAALKLSTSVVVAGSGIEYAPQPRPARETDALLPATAYGVSKASASLLASLYADRMPITILRLFNVYGPGEKEPRLAPYLIAQTRRGAPIELTAGAQLRDFTYVKDVAEAFWRAFSLPPQDGKLRAINLASGRAITLRNFIEMFADELGRYQLNADLRFGAQPYRTGEPMNYTADISLLRETFGWAPATELSAGIAEMVRLSL